MKKVLVTGADGFIGSHLAEHLVRRGYDVRAFVLYNSFNSWGWLDRSPLRGEFDVFCGDVRDPFGVRRAVEGCDTVMHLAALIAIPYSYHSPATYIETNVQGTLNLLQAARDLGVDRFIHTSTSEVYGSAQFVPMTEAHPLQAQSPYAASKIGADQLALSFHLSFDTPVVVARPFNTYGPRQSARAFIPTIITQIASGMREIRVGNLSPTRDLNFVSDTVRGFEAAALSAQSVGEVINLGSGFEVSMGDTARLIAEEMGCEIRFLCEAERVRPEKSEVTRLWSDNSKARQLLGWTPEFAGVDGLRRGLGQTIEWFLVESNLSAYKAEIYNQ